MSRSITSKVTCGEVTGIDSYYNLQLILKLAWIPSSDEQVTQREQALSL